MHSTMSAIAFLVVWLFLIVRTVTSAQPNVVVFLVDDLGIADVGCFGNDTIKTPNIDQLAREGARLTHNLAPESVCTPSRAAFLTGRYAIRSGLASNPNVLRMFLFMSAPGGLPQNETTFAEVLQDAGYATGYIGKWHLGLNLHTSDDYHFHPMRQGFQHFYGLPLTNLRECRPGHSLFELLYPKTEKNIYYALIFVALSSVACRVAGLLSKRWAIFLILLCISIYGGAFVATKIRWHFTCLLMRGYEVVEQPIVLQNLTVRLTEDAVQFIEEHQSKPFLLFMSFAKVHTALFTSKRFKGHSVHGPYGDNVEEMDWSVGEIMNTLERLGVKNNTFVYFTSDHGPHLEEITREGERHGGWKGIYRGGKGQSFEGGIRVPTIVSWPSRIQGGINITEPTNSFDIFPTVINIAGKSPPKDRIIDGKNIMPLLLQQEKYSPHEFMFHYCAKALHAVRYRPRHGTTTWKAHFVIPNWIEGTDICNHVLCYDCFYDQVIPQDPPLLYDITSDPSESHPLDPQAPQYKKIMKIIKAALKEHQDHVDDVPNQLDLNTFYSLPLLQPCCNFPFCSCIENATQPQP